MHKNYKTYLTSFMLSWYHKHEGYIKNDYVNVQFNMYIILDKASDYVVKNLNLPYTL